MKMKHPKVTGIIKAYKSLKQLRLLCFILQVQTCTQLIVIPTDDVTLGPHLCTQTWLERCNRHPLPIMQLFFLLLLSLLVSSVPTLCYPKGLTKQKKKKKKLSAPLNSLHPNHPLSNRKGTTVLPSATNLGQTKAKSARISHYTCFPSSLSPERTREKERDFEVSIYWDSGASNHTRITFCCSLSLPQWKMWEERWGLVED